MAEKFVDPGHSASERSFNGFRGAIAESNPENLGRVPFEKASLTKIGVLGDNRVPVLSRECPDR
jgi:hypothetical protein